MVYILAEGVDSSGKTSITNGITEYLGNEGYEVTNWNEPYLLETDNLLKLTKGLRTTDPEYFDKVKDDLFAMIFSVDRYIVGSELREILKTKHMIADRSFVSTYAYQRDAGFMFLDFVSEHVVKPDHILYLDVDPKVASERLAQRDGCDIDYFEQEDLLKKHRTNYLEVLRYLDIPYTIINANNSFQEVLDDCLEVVLPYIKGG
jgi:dTMP kinase